MRPIEKFSIPGCFSPLFIGELSSTRFARPPPGASCGVSVPSSSGNSLQRSGPGVRSGGGVVSVPSSSGNSLQRISSVAAVNDITVSVPSSSGNSLQQYLKLPSVPDTPRFSPLFIGELSSTATKTSACQGGHKVSVPSSSGNSLQQEHYYVFPRFYLRFSPLFIGELSSTRPVVDLTTHGHGFQSPLHRGTLFNAAGQAVAVLAARVSVPSSSGNSLQRC